MKPHEKVLATLSALVLVGIPLVCVLLTGCAFGNADWRRESYNVEVRLRGAGDERCSSPAPWTNFRACLGHDAAYESARRARCRGSKDPTLVSEQARLVADYDLAKEMAADGYGEVWIELYREAVRRGGWWAWYFESCEP